MEIQCQVCGTSRETMFACGGCEETFYCSDKCQDAHIGSGMHDYCLIEGKRKKKTDGDDDKRKITPIPDGATREEIIEHLKRGRNNDTWTNKMKLKSPDEMTDVELANAIKSFNNRVAKAKKDAERRSGDRQKDWIKTVQVPPVSAHDDETPRETLQRYRAWVKEASVKDKMKKWREENGKPYTDESILEFVAHVRELKAQGQPKKPKVPEKEKEEEEREDEEHEMGDAGTYMRRMGKGKGPVRNDNDGERFVPLDYRGNETQTGRAKVYPKRTKEPSESLREEDDLFSSSSSPRPKVITTPEGRKVAYIPSNDSWRAKLPTQPSQEDDQEEERAPRRLPNTQEVELYEEIEDDAQRLVSFLQAERKDAQELLKYFRGELQRVEDLLNVHGDNEYIGAEKQRILSLIKRFQNKEAQLRQSIEKEEDLLSRRADKANEMRRLKEGRSIEKRWVKY